MKKKGIIASLALTLTLAGGITAFAAAPEVSSASNPVQNCLNYGKNMAVKGYTIVSNVLKDKFGVTDAEINNALESGKTMYDVAKDKGVTDEQLKSSVIEERTKAIDQAVKDGTITKEQADFMKERMKTNSTNMTPGQHGRGGFGGGMRGARFQTAPSSNSQAQ